MAELVRSGGSKALAPAVDVSSDSVFAAVRRCLDELGPATLIVNCAGAAFRGTLLRTKPEDWGRVIETNLIGYFCVLATAARAMAEAGGGSIAQVSSVAGQIGMSSTAYAAAKGAVIAFTPSSPVSGGRSGSGSTRSAAAPSSPA
jgi:3-oxoacyl-[acyl-carrier protein] reductase